MPKCLEVCYILRFTRNLSAPIFETIAIFTESLGIQLSYHFGALN